MSDAAAGPAPDEDVLPSARQRRATLLVAALGTFMVFLDTTIVSVALPEIGADLAVTGGIHWVISGYLLALGVAQPLTGWLAARLGPKRALLGSLSLFIVASIAAGAAPTLPFLIAARVAQGLTGGLLVPLSTTILFATFPPERRGTVIGLSGMLVMAAPALGPVISGYVLDVTTWRWLLLLNAPVGLLCIATAARGVPETGEREERPLDLLGLVLVGVALTCVLLAFSETESSGWTSPTFLLLAVAGVGLLGGYVKHALRAEHPLVDLSIYRERTFTTAILITWAISLTQFARTVFVPVELQVIHGLTPLRAGAILAASGLASAAVMPLAGRWTDRAGGRAPALTGTFLLLLAVARLATLAVDTPLWHVVAALVLVGAGIVLVTMPTTVVALNAIPERLVPEGASVRSLNREVAGAVSTSVLAAVIVARAGSITPTAATGADLLRQQSAYNLAFLVALGGLLLALGLAWTLPSSSQGGRREQEVSRGRPPPTPRSRRPPRWRARRAAGTSTS